VTTLKDVYKWEPIINILKASKITQLAMQKWMAVVSSARELNVLKGIKSTTKELNILSGAKVTATQLNKYLLPNVTTVSEATYTVLDTDFILHVDYTATGVVAISIPTKFVKSGRSLSIKDSGGNAHVNNITITGEGGELIDGEASLVICGPYDAPLIYTEDDKMWVY
jgi:hypothetical protein